MSCPKITITKLSNSNYQIWKCRVELLLIKEDLWHTVKEERPEPVDQKWIKADMQARATIGLLLEDDQIRHIKDTTTAKEAWDSLRRYHEKATLSNQVYLLKKLCNIKLTDNGNMEEHLNIMLSTVDKLAALGEEIKEKLVIAMVLSSLPDSYGTLITALETRSENELTLELVKGKLIDEDFRRRNSGSQPAEKDSIALKAQHQRSNKLATAQSKVQTTTCYFCNKQGHIKRDCYKYQKWKTNKERANQVSETKSKEEPEYCFSTRARINKGNTRGAWFVDSGATSHMTNDKSFFNVLEKRELADVRVANQQYAKVKGIGEGILLCESADGHVSPVRVKDVLFVPDLGESLLSVKKLTEKGIEVNFCDKLCYIKKGNKVIVTASAIGNLYKLKIVNQALLATCKHNKECIHTWHRKLGHRDPQAIKEMVDKNLVDNMQIKDCGMKITCEVCIKGKMQRQSFPKRSSTRAKKILELIHTDVCGPMQTITPSKKRYFLTLIDDFSRYTHIYFLQHKSEVPEKIANFIELMKTKYGTKPKCFRSDRGREYINHRLEKMFQEEGIEMQNTVAYCPEQNGVAERKNRSLMEMGRCLLRDADLPNKYWAEAVNTANYLQNRIYSKALDNIPIKKWDGTKPNMKNFHRFGAKVYAHVPDELRRKLDAKAQKFRFVGYSEESKGYRLLDPETNKVTISRDVKFLEKEGDENEIVTVHHETPRIQDSVSKESTEESLSSESEAQEPGEEQQPEEEFDDAMEGVSPECPRTVEMKRGPGRPKIIRTGSRGRPRKEYNTIPENGVAEMASIAEIQVHKAISSPEAEEWYAAIGEEVKSMLKKDVFDIVDRPREGNVIDSKVVLTDKLNSDGTIGRRKARIVARGFTQRPGFDYNETFSPVARLGSIRLLVALATRFSMEIHQLDVTTAYLNSELDVPLYMEIPESFKETLERIVSRKECAEITSRASTMLSRLRTGDKVCSLKKAIYGLKQAGRQWNIMINNKIIELGMKRSTADPCIYYKKEKKSLLLLVLYVDDILIMSDNIKAIFDVKEKLSSSMELRDLGIVKYCLGINFTKEGDNYILNQSKYIERLLVKYNMSDAKPICIPLVPGLKLSKCNVSRECEALPYRELLGCLMYLAVTTRPDIAFAISYLSQFNNGYNRVHWNAARGVLRYLKGTAQYRLAFKRDAEHIKGYVDSDWGNCVNDRHSYTGFVFMLCAAPIAWESRKQRTVALSSTEAEYMGLADATKEGIYLRNFLSEIGLKEMEQITLYNDNLGAQKLAENPMYHRRTKHIDLRHHFVREAIQNSDVVIEYLKSEDMTADILTKALPRARHDRCVRGLGIET